MTRIPAHTIIAALIIAASLLVAPALASEGAPSTVPHAFYGQVYGPDGSNAPAGSIIVASVEGDEAGTILVGPAGAYGTAYGGGAKLVVWTPALQPGDAITFYIDGVRVNESAAFESGGVTDLTLRASAALPKERPEESTTRPVNATGGQPVTLDGGGASAVLTTTGDFQGETIVFTLFTSSPDDQPALPGARDVGRYAEITSTITNDNIQQVTVRVRYTDADGIDESSIRVSWWNTTLAAREQLPGGVDTAANVARGKTDHFSTSGLFGAASGMEAPSSRPPLRSPRWTPLRPGRLRGPNPSRWPRSCSLSSRSVRRGSCCSGGSNFSFFVRAGLATSEHAGGSSARSDSYSKIGPKKRR